MHCIGCCVRLVLSAQHPDKAQAKAMLASIARYEGAPSRAEVLAGVRTAMKG